MSADSEVDAGAYLQTLTKVEPFVGPFVAASRASVTGTLMTVAAGAPTVVHFERGVPVHVERGRLSLTLGRLLIDRGVLSDAQYETVMEAMSRKPSGQRFGAVAVEQGFLTEAQVDAALFEQTREKILACFEASAPRSGFASAGELDASVPRHPVEVDALVLTGVRRFFDPARAERVLQPFRQQFPALIGEADAVGDTLGLKPREVDLLRQLDAARSLDSLLGATSLDELHAAHILASLLLLVRLELHPRRQAGVASLRARQVTRVAVELPKAPQPVAGVANRLLRKLGMRKVTAEVPVAAPPSVAETTRKAENARASARRNAARAELLFRRGKHAIEQGRADKALADLKEAASMYPEAFEYVLYRAWAELQTANDPPAAEQARARVKDTALRAVRAEPRFAFAHQAYATVLLAEGDEAGALKAFRVALKLEPNNLEAQRFVRVLSRRVK